MPVNNVNKRAHSGEGKGGTGVLGRKFHPGGKGKLKKKLGGAANFGGIQPLGGTRLRNCHE